MNQRVSAILVIALLVSGAATLLVYRMVAQRLAAGATLQSVVVVKATHSLDVGVLLRDSDLTTGPWLGPLPAGMATKKDPLLGRGVLSPIYEGEPIMETRVAPSGAGAGLAATIPPGMRAVAVRVDDIVAVAGFVTPGTRVDVLVDGTPPNATGTNGSQVKTVLQNIPVLSAGQNYQKDAEGKPVVVPVVNLLVSPEQAETLSLASKETRIQLVLRNPLDTQLAKTQGVSVAGLFGGPKPPPAPPAPRAMPVRAVIHVPEPVRPELLFVPLPPVEIEILNGAQSSVAKFAQPLGEKK